MGWFHPIRPIISGRLIRLSVVLINTQAAVKLISRSFSMDKTMLSMADGIAASIIATDFSNPENRNNVTIRAAKNGDIRSLKVLTIAASFNEDLITLKSNDNPKEIIIRGTAALER